MEPEKQSVGPRFTTGETAFLNLVEWTLDREASPTRGRSVPGAPREPDSPAALMSHDPDPAEPTARALNAAARGDPAAARLLLPVVYEELRKLARNFPA